MTRIRRIYERRKKVEQHLPEASQVIRASLIERYTVCGKPTCRCSKGNLHGPYYYLSITYPKGKKEMVYVSTSQKKKVEEFIANYQRYKKGLEEISRINIELIKGQKPLSPVRGKPLNGVKKRG